jgi:DNA-directed RNA polymerase subunit beta'
MILSSPINKSSLEEIIQQSFENFGTIFTSSLLDSLKNIGFYYSTSSGVSLTIEDLKIPLSKDYLLADVSTDIKNIEFAWKNGQISNTEKFKSIVNNWELISDSLKEKLIDYYKNYDPTNSLYLMAFSGARGNISQVRQVVGMRGLMVNQRGNIIQLPILTNFKEGLSTIDYIISSYGARKGIIDTALRTADAGYLTRRLIYLVQDISIRDICCNSNYSLLIDLKKNLDNSLLGRTLVEIKYLQNQKRVKLPNLLITQSLYNLLKKNTNIIHFIKIRSNLTSKIPNSL